MFCPNCGANNIEGAAICSQCGSAMRVGGTPAPAATPGAPVTPGGAKPNIPNYLVQSILVTIFCCWPLGIPAIIFAAQVNSKLAQNDIAGAMESSRKAKMFCWIALGLGCVVAVIYVILFAVGALSNMR